MSTKPFPVDLRAPARRRCTAGGKNGLESHRRGGLAYAGLYQTLRPYFAVVRDGCQYTHAAIEATLALHGRLGQRSAEDIAEIVVETHPRGLTLDTAEPATVLAAKFSMPHAAAASALMGTGGQVAFSETALRDERIAQLRRRVRLAPHGEIGPFPKDRPSRVTWRFRDGESWTESCESARGGADQPFDEPTLIRKLQENSAGFPHMAGILEMFIAGHIALDSSWRETVRRMTEGSTEVDRPSNA